MMNTVWALSDLHPETAVPGWCRAATKATCPNRRRACTCRTRCNPTCPPARWSFHGQTWHGGGANHSDEMRTAMLAHYRNGLWLRFQCDPHDGFREEWLRDMTARQKELLRMTNGVDISTGRTSTSAELGGAPNSPSISSSSPRLARARCASWSGTKSTSAPGCGPCRPNTHAARAVANGSCRVRHATHLPGSPASRTRSASRPPRRRRSRPPLPSLPRLAGQAREQPLRDHPRRSHRVPLTPSRKQAAHVEPSPGSPSLPSRF